MGDEYDAAEADYWENQEQYEAELELDRFYGVTLDHYGLMPEISIARGGIQFNAVSPAVTGAGVYPHYCLTPEVHNTTERNNDMRNDQDILTQAEELRAEAERLEQIVAEREKYGADPFKNGTVLKVEMRYRTGSRRSFAYAVVKVAGKFYLTGRLARAATDDSTSVASGFTWEQFVAWLSQGDATVWQAKSLQQVF